MRWDILSKGRDIKKILLKNRGIKNESDFFNPTNPKEIKLTNLGIKKADIRLVLKRLDKAKKNKESVIVYGDYDADGICATAILWESLHNYGLNVLPHIPDRFNEGYGINSTSVKNLNSQFPNLKLIITIDNGIVAYDGIKTAAELGIDVIIIDHHTIGATKPKAYSILHDTKVCGSALAYLFAKEISDESYLDLATIGTIADQMPLAGVNRSIVKFGLKELENTKRVGLRSLFDESKIEKIGTYEVNYIIVPRLNAMGRLGSGIDSLRLICTRKLDRSLQLTKLLSKTNLERQKIVSEVVIHTLAQNKDNLKKIIVIAHESYHEGVIGLAAGKLAEEFFRPSIVLSSKGLISKASARSINGFNIIEAIKKTGLIIEGGGHPMAAGFSIETAKISEFNLAINKIADKLLTEELLERKIKIDCEINFDQITYSLGEDLKQFEPFGQGNYPPLFASHNVEIVYSKLVGKEGKHIKLKLKEGDKILDAIYFNVAKDQKLTTGDHVDAAFSIEENVWNGQTSLQLKIRDIKIN